MEKERKIKTLSIIALIVAVLGLTVAFAALSTTLNITGTAKVPNETTSWDIHFDNLNTELIGEGKVTTAPTVSATEIKGYEVSILKPGDGAKFTFDVVNSGKIDATLSSITELKPVCTVTNPESSAEADKVCADLTYTLTYTDSGDAVAANDVLNKGTTKNLTLTLVYNNNVSTTLPSDDVTIEGLAISLIYTQK